MLKNGNVNTPKVLTYAWLFFNITHERVTIETTLLQRNHDVSQSFIKKKHKSFTQYFKFPSTMMKFQVSTLK